MGTISLPNLDAIMEIKDPDRRFEELVNTVGILIKNLSELNGYINSKNVFEVGGWVVNSTSLASKTGDVGMSTAISGIDNVRLWAGGSVPESAPWRVYNSGKSFQTAAHIQSGNSYPRVVMDPEATLFGAYTSSTDYIAMQAQSFLGFIFPYLDFSYANVFHTYMFQDGLKFGLQSDTDINIYSSGSITLQPLGDVLINRATFDSWYDVKTPTSNLQAELNAKSNVGHTHSGVIDVPEGGGTVYFTVS